MIAGIPLYVVVIVAAVVGVPVCVFLVSAFNGLIGLRNRADQAFATIDVMLKRRYDLVPNLVACVTGYLNHERQTLAEITTLRAQALAGGLSQDQTLDLNQQMGRDLGRIMAVAEAYPQLRAIDNFLQLQRSLNEIEEQLAAARRAFNAAVTEYNNAVQMFPGSLAAALFRFKVRRLFEAAGQERPAPEVRTVAPAADAK